MKIGINGVGGQLGAATVRHLMSRVDAADVVGISRTPKSAEALGVEGRFGDYDDTASLETAYRGLDSLLLIPTVDLRPGARARQTIGAVEAAVAAGVGHIVYFSSLGTRDVAEPNVWAGYYATEQALMRKARRWSVLRMGYYMESLIQEARQSLAIGVHAGLADTPVSFVARDDLAAAAAGLLATGGHAGAIYQGTGPATFTGTERAAAISKAAGTPYGFVSVTREQYEGGLRHAGLPDDVVNVVLSIQSGFAAGGFDLTSGDVGRLSGRKPKTLEAALAEAFAG
jgi:NAD(P)H dehydrogenase (quinone)